MLEGATRRWPEMLAGQHPPCRLSFALQTFIDGEAMFAPCRYFVQTVYDPRDLTADELHKLHTEPAKSADAEVQLWQMSAACDVFFLRQRFGNGGWLLRKAAQIIESVIRTQPRKILLCRLVSEMDAKRLDLAAKLLEQLHAVTSWETS